MHEAWQKGDVAAAMKINERLAPLHDALFVETSPAPVKYACSLLGQSSAEVRLPLVAASRPGAGVGAHRHAFGGRAQLSSA